MTPLAAFVWQLQLSYRASHRTTNTAMPNLRHGTQPRTPERRTDAGVAVSAASTSAVWYGAMVCSLLQLLAGVHGGRDIYRAATRVSDAEGACLRPGCDRFRDPSRTLGNRSTGEGLFVRTWPWRGRSCAHRSR